MGTEGGSVLRLTALGILFHAIYAHPAVHTDCSLPCITSVGIDAVPVALWEGGVACF